jgi:hypothetical protein
MDVSNPAPSQSTPHFPSSSAKMPNTKVAGGMVAKEQRRGMEERGGRAVEGSAHSGHHMNSSPDSAVHTTQVVKTQRCWMAHLSGC